jgi:hypothetical protein
MTTRIASRVVVPFMTKAPQPLVLPA